MKNLYDELIRIQKMCEKRKYCITLKDNERDVCPLYDRNDGECILTECPSLWTLKENQAQIQAFEKE